MKIIDLLNKQDKALTSIEIADYLGLKSPEEIKQFNKLTPAQKVLFIQKNFADDQGIFNYIKVTLLNNTDVKYPPALSRNQRLHHCDSLSNRYIRTDDSTYPHEVESRRRSLYIPSSNAYRPIRR